MAISFNLPDIGRRIMPEETGVPDYVKALSAGLDLGAKPGKLTQELLSQTLANKINQVKAQYAPQMEAASLQSKLAEAARTQQLASQPFGGMLTGAPKEAYALELMRQQLGEDNPAYQNAKRAYDLSAQGQQGLNSYRQSLIDTAAKRASSPLAKLQQEQEEVEQGFMPGTGGQVPLSEDEQQILKGQYDLQRQKLTTDLDTRKKGLYATNMDKTLDSINVRDLTQFGGLAGGIVKKIQEGKALTGNENEAYRKYHDSLTAAKLLAKQVRQFYGDSITPGVQEQLNLLTNPASWTNNAVVATRKFNQFKSILKKETQTYRDALRSTNIYKEGASSDKEAGNNNDPLGLGF